MRKILLAVVAAGLVGCVGGIDTPTTPPPSGVGGGGGGSAAVAARKAFDDNIYPMISASGRCVTCHSASGAVGNVTGFVATTAAEGYVTAVGYQAVVGDWTATGAPTITKITAAGGHNGMTYTDTEKSKITEWLTQELASRTSGGTTPPPTDESPAAATVRLTQEWSGCMTLANFATANMKTWGNMQANNSACKTCHNRGEYGQIADDADNPFFTIISTNKYYMAQYFSVDLSTGVKNAKVIINERSFTGVGQGLAPHIEHPRFNLANSAGLKALTTFYNLTMAAKNAVPPAAPCGPPTLMN